MGMLYFKRYSIFSDAHILDLPFFAIQKTDLRTNLVFLFISSLSLP